jgi:hypothetical protein
MKGIPVLIAVCYEVLENMRGELVLGSVWMAVENMLLSATAGGWAIVRTRSIMTKKRTC